MTKPAINSVVKVTTAWTMPEYHENHTEGRVVANDSWMTPDQFVVETGNPDYPKSIISLHYVKDIEYVSGSSVTVDLEDFVQTVTGSRGEAYTVARKNQAWTCTCTGFKFRRNCKHIGQAQAQKN